MVTFRVYQDGAADIVLVFPVKRLRDTRRQTTPCVAPGDELDQPTPYYWYLEFSGTNIADHDLTAMRQRCQNGRETRL